MSTNATEFLKNLLGTAYKSHHEINKQKHAQQSFGTPGHFSATPKVDRHLQRLLYLSLTAIFAFVGTEPVKVIYRKNFGFGGINLLCLIISCFFFLVLGVISLIVGIAALLGSFTDSKEYNFIQGEGGGISFLIVGLLYIQIARYSFFKGLKDIKESKSSIKPVGYLGDSALLSGLKKEGWSQDKIQWVAEPLLTILIGVCICLFNILGGIPIILCGLSLWVYLFIDHFFLQDDLNETVNRMNNQARKNENFNDVETDI